MSQQMFLLNISAIRRVFGKVALIKSNTESCLAKLSLLSHGGDPRGNKNISRVINKQNNLMAEIRLVNFTLIFACKKEKKELENIEVHLA